MVKENINVLYLDYEIQNLHAFRANFRKDFTVYTAASYQEALNLLKNHPIHVLLTDPYIPLVNGVDFIKLINEEFPEVINILVTGYLHDSHEMEAILAKGEVFRYICKPWSDQEVRIVVEDAYKVYAFLADRKKELDCLKSHIKNCINAPIANLEGLISLASTELNDVGALKDYLAYMSQSIELLKQRLISINQQHMAIQEPE